jgi:hypothetical protein
MDLTHQLRVSTLKNILCREVLLRGGSKIELEVGYLRRHPP